MTLLRLFLVATIACNLASSSRGDGWGNINNENRRFPSRSIERVRRQNINIPRFGGERRKVFTNRQLKQSPGNNVPVRMKQPQPQQEIERRQLKQYPTQQENAPEYNYRDAERYNFEPEPVYEEPQETFKQAPSPYKQPPRPSNVYERSASIRQADRKQDNEISESHAIPHEQRNIEAAVHAGAAGYSGESYNDAKRLAFQIHGQGGPHSYRFGYDTGVGYNRQFRYEERDANGVLHGRYGYYDQEGKLQIVNYTADPVAGFHAEGEHVPKPQY